MSGFRGKWYAPKSIGGSQIGGEKEGGGRLGGQQQFTHGSLSRAARL